MARTRQNLLFPTNLGECPHCQVNGEFSLILHGYTVFFVTLSSHFIACNSCGNEWPINNEDEGSYENLAEIYVQMKSGAFTDSMFRSYIDASNSLEVLKSVIADSETWLCHCGEKNPGNFGNCWKCDESAPGEIRESSDQLIYIGGQHPWEK